MARVAQVAVLQQVITQPAALLLYLIILVRLAAALGLVITQLPQQVVAHQVADWVVAVAVAAVHLQQIQVVLEIHHLHHHHKEITLVHLLTMAVQAAVVLAQ